MIVHYELEQMRIEKCGENYLAYREFDDKFERNKHYRLIYYKWKPMTEDEKAEEEAKKFLI